MTQASIPPIEQTSMLNDITKAWITPWDSTLATLSIGLPMGSPIHADQMKFEERQVHTITIKLLSDDALLKIYQAIGEHLGIGI